MKPGAKILVIDDNADFRHVLKTVLEGKGHFVFQAGDGEEALEQMGRTAFNMAIVDLDMPRMNGIEFSKRAKKKNPQFPIIMVTAFASFYSPADILASGVDAFLQKPVDLETLSKAVDRL
jgi:CheY-like chemotaxis protein